VLFSLVKKAKLHYLQNVFAVDYWYFAKIFLSLDS